MEKPTKRQAIINAILSAAEFLEEGSSTSDLPEAVQETLRRYGYRKGK